MKRLYIRIYRVPLILKIFVAALLMASVYHFGLALADPSYTVSGVVTVGGQPLIGATVIIDRDSDLTAVTDSNGFYSINNVFSGQAEMQINYWGENATGLTFTNGESGYYFNVNSNTTQNESFDTNNVTVNAVYADGSPVTNGEATFDVSNTGVLTDTNGINFNGEDIENRGPLDSTSGTGTFDVFPGNSYNLCVSGGYQANVCINTGTISADSTYTITLPTPPESGTVSGIVTVGGQPLVGATVVIDGDSSTDSVTDSNGYYSIPSVPGGESYMKINYYGQGAMGLEFTNGQTGYFFYVNGNTTQNESFDTNNVTVNVIYANGYPVTNSEVTLIDGGSLATITDTNGVEFRGESIENFGSVDPNSGIGTFAVFPGNSYQLCANGWNEEYDCVNTGTINSDSVFTITLPTPPPFEAPTNLTSSSYTNQYPVLSWNPVDNVTYYNIYRNGTDIGSSTTPSFTDTNAPQGNNTYFVTDVSYYGVESSSSNDINVIYDTTAPSISYSLSPSSPNGTNNWYNSPVTVTFTCSDPTSGVAITSCTAPVTLSTDGSNQTVTGTAVDSAGNTASVTTSAINIDQTSPVLGSSWSTNPTISGQSTTLTVLVTDATSGVQTGEYYIGSTDPGQGQGTPMAYNSSTGSLSATLGSSLAPGTYTINFRAQDNAGNWSSVSSTLLTVNPINAPTNLAASSYVTNQAPSLTWTAASGASYYIVYRNNAEIGTSSTNTFTDNNAPQGSNTYCVYSVDSYGVTSTNCSNTITVTYDTTPPTITYTVSPAPNSNGWNNTAVTVTFACSDSGTGVGIYSCTAPVTLTNNGSNQTVTGTAVDNAGNTASVTTKGINIDGSVPMVGTPLWSTNPVVTGNNTTLTVPTSAAPGLSSITGGEYYIGSTDPGKGNATAMSYDSTTGNLTANVGTNLSPGTYTFNIRDENAAGQWSSTVSTTLTVKPSAIAPTITSANNYSIGVRQIITPADFTVTTTGAPAPTLTESGTLPSGLTFTDNGNGTANFTGMVADGTAGTYTFTITATNSAGSVTQSFTLTITQTNSAPTTIFTSTGSDTMNATVGTPFSVNFTMTGEGKNYKLFLYSGTLPAGLNIHDNKDGTGTISGTPTAAGTYTFVLEAQNSEGIAYLTFNVDVSS